MKKVRARLSAALFLSLSLIASCGFAASASQSSADIVLDVPAEFTASSITAAGEGLYCISGDVYHDEVPNHSAMMLLVDTRARRVLWKTDIPYAKNHFENAGMKCIRHGDFYYALTEERTDSSAAQSHTQLIVSKISSTGKLLKAQRIDIGADVWENLFEEGPDGLSIVGGTSTDAVDRDGKRSLFLVRLDQDLARKQTVVLPTGAFWTGSYAKLDGASLLISGQFLANPGASASVHEGYAVSRIDLGKMRYVWSTFVYPTNIGAQGAVSLPDGGIADVGMSGDRLSISLIDASGRVARRVSMKSAICSVDALSVKAALLQIVGTGCGDKHAALLLDIDPAAGAIVASRDLGDGATGASFDGDALWTVVAQSNGERQVLRRVIR